MTDTADTTTAWPDAVERPADAERLAYQVATTGQAVETIMQHMQAAIADTMARYLPQLRPALAAQRRAADALLEHVTDQGPAAYPKGARSQIAHGVEYGYRLGKPAIEIPDHGRSIAAARELYSPADCAAIIDTVETLRASAIAAWTDADLARIHARRVPGDDAPFVRAAPGDLDRAVKAISAAALKAAGKEAA
jgi:hypothetical protein